MPHNPNPAAPVGTVEHWQAATHRDALVREYGLDPAANPVVTCACGRRVLADVCVDVTVLPAAVRFHLAIASVDYLCDGCVTRLTREQHLTEADFLALLGAPSTLQAFAQARDAEHQRGIANRAAIHRPTHAPLNVHALAARSVVPTGTAPSAPLPLQRRRMTHGDSVLDLQRAGILAAPPSPHLP